MSLDFQTMDLPAPVRKALLKMGFEKPTPIQAAAIPVALTGSDVIGRAQTGTGKTAAFCIPVVSRFINDPFLGALILVPTRELALQIIEVLRQFSSVVPQLKTALLIGGVDMGRQIRDLRQNPAVIVATPGRLMDHLRRKSVNLERVGMLVLDEGDRMLDMGFEPQINQIFKFVRPERQTMLFSATMPDRVQKLVKKYLNQPKFISVGEESKPVGKINHRILQISRQKKQDVLLDELNARAGSVLIFVNTKHGTNRLTTYLEEYGYAVTRIHGGRSQGQRNQALQGFRSGRFRIMVATDVAARGIDVPNIAHVINFELPRDHEDYIHRIGRTARAGAEGEALCLLAKEDHNLWNRIARNYSLETVPGGERDMGERRGMNNRGGGMRKKSSKPRHKRTNNNYSKRSGRSAFA